ncbi:MAG: hypothetical protein SFU98_10470 [Leptospiraceae bacterium]|nr:hypothetical protein [Leptospiraceae bacterium]
MEEENQRVKIIIAILLFGFLFYRIIRFFYILFFGIDGELHAWLLVAGISDFIGFLHLISCGIFSYCFLF